MGALTAGELGYPPNWPKVGVAKVHLDVDWGERMANTFLEEIWGVEGTKEGVKGGPSWGLLCCSKGVERKVAIVGVAGIVPFTGGRCCVGDWTRQAEPGGAEYSMVPWAAGPRLMSGEVGAIGAIVIIVVVIIFWAPPPQDPLFVEAAAPAQAQAEAEMEDALLPVRLLPPAAVVMVAVVVMAVVTGVCMTGTAGKTAAELLRALASCMEASISMERSEGPTTAVAATTGAIVDDGNVPGAAAGVVAVAMVVVVVVASAVAAVAAVLTVAGAADAAAEWPTGTSCPDTSLAAF
mmetsp:Transcript_21458/g.46650  ORF Transcript_21458/g.46650 Transcript_21458/m.46650 type:complete len:293 (-) Transcript_21458:230-1108(-)